MIEMNARIERILKADLPAEEIYFILADVPYSAAHFPGVERLVEEAGGYTWHLEPVGFRGFRIRSTYACRYTLDPERMRVDWTPIETIGNARTRGRWTLSHRSGSTTIGLDTEFVIRIDAPALLRPAASAFLTRQLSRTIDRYLANLTRTFQGADGRVSLLPERERDESR